MTEMRTTVAQPLAALLLRRRHPRSPRARTPEPRATAHAVCSGLWVLESWTTGLGIGRSADPTAGHSFSESSRRNAPPLGSVPPVQVVGHLAAEGTRRRRSKKRRAATAEVFKDQYVAHLSVGRSPQRGGAYATAVRTRGKKLNATSAR